MINIAVNIVNWQQPGLTIETINSLLKIKHSRFNYHIFLIDNGSLDDSLTIFKNKYKSNKLISIKSIPINLGFSAGNNYGISAALKENFDYILLLNNDVIVDPNFLEHLLTPFITDPKIGMTGPKIYFAPGFEFHKDRYKKSDIGKVIWSAGGSMDWNNVYSSNTGIDEVDRGQYDHPKQPVSFLSNCCVLVKTSAIKKVGLMPEDYFMYCEDADYCANFIKSGFTLIFQPDSVIWHINSGSTKAGGGPFHDYFLTRNRLILGSKYTGIRTNFALFRESIKLLIGGTTWQKKGVLDFYLGVRKKGSWR